MHHIIYLSLATEPFSSEQLEQLLTRARQRNAELDITGVLLYGNQRFLQVLEGEEAAVRALYAAIRRDPRHQNVLTYVDKPLAQRAFAQWAMAFQSGSLAPFAGLFGYLGQADVRIDASSLPPFERHVFELLRSFTLP